MVKKRGRALVCLALACAVLVGGLVACEQTQNGGPDQAVEELENTITYDGQTVSFTLPEGKRDWSLHIAGRAEVEWLGGMSLHYLDETAWTPGETYSFDLDGESVGDITELSMYIDLEGQSYTVDLLPHVREYSKPYPYYHNYDYGFTPVSYTHLDVYKRQAFIQGKGSKGKANLKCFLDGMLVLAEED